MIRIRVDGAYEAPVSNCATFRIRQIINDVPLRDQITPHYAQLGVLKLPEMVKLCYLSVFL